MRDLYDPWIRFAATGKIEDYISYRAFCANRVAPVYSEDNVPDISAGVALSSNGIKQITEQPGQSL